MFLGDKGKPNKFRTLRLNYDIIIDNEKLTLQKLTRNLGFYTVRFAGSMKEIETVYDTEKKLFSGAGLILRKKTTPARTYFSLVRISSISSPENREKKTFMGECELQDQPSDFPVQIADQINRVFNNLFTVNVVDIVKHCTPYIRIDITGNRYKIVSGTGYEAEISFENLKVRNARNGRKGTVRNFSIKMELNPDFERERLQILDVIDRYCKELAPLNRNRFEIGEILVRDLQPRDKETKKDKNKKKKKEEENAEE